LALIPLEAESVGLPPYRQGIEFPNPDFAALARACGGQGFRAMKPDELHDEINEALTVGGPAVVDCVVAADEMPNLPHIDLETVGNFAVAKIREAPARSDRAVTARPRLCAVECLSPSIHRRHPAGLTRGSHLLCIDFCKDDGCAGRARA
jgi:hypothetical protein